MAYTAALIVSMGIIYPVLAIFATCLRFWVRLRVRPQRLWWDDWLVVFAAFLVTGQSIAYIIQVYYGLSGQTSGDLNPDPTSSPRARVQAQINFAAVVMEKPCYGALKLSVLLFYRRIFTVRSFRIANDVLIALMICWTLAFFISNTLSCGAHPTDLWNNPSLCGTKYGPKNPPALNLWFGITDIIGDAAILSLPYLWIRRLHMSSRERWGVAGIFMLGWLSFAAGVARLAFVIIAHQMDEAAFKAGRPTPLYEPPAFWTLTEISIGVIAANFPPLGPLIRRAPTPASVASTTRKMSAGVVRGIRNGILSNDKSNYSRQDSIPHGSISEPVVAVKMDSLTAPGPWPDDREGLRTSVMFRQYEEIANQQPSKNPDVSRHDIV